jgi:hypothetical protein
MDSMLLCLLYSLDYYRFNNSRVDCQFLRHGITHQNGAPVASFPMSFGNAVDFLCGINPASTGKPLERE